MLSYYKPFTDKKGVTYSLDMVRYNYTIFSQHMNDFIHLINHYDYVQNCNKTYFRNSKSIGYTDLWSFEFGNDKSEKGSFSLGRQLNFKKENAHSRFY